jgi:hypothetical protein
MREQTSSSRILIADDHRLLADACKSLLEPEFQVVGVVTDGRCLIRSAVAKYRLPARYSPTARRST